MSSLAVPVDSSLSSSSPSHTPVITNTTAPLPGRVVRLHFECHATLPIGSFLRVTGGNLWAPGSNAALNDPTEAASTDNNDGAGGSGGGGLTAASATASSSAAGLTGSGDESGGSLYTTSVEMVTSPETYPVWRTRKPVVVILNRHSKRVQHHYYRYLVVSPGVTESLESSSSAALVVSTSSEYLGSTAVTQWEEPFQNTKLDERINNTNNQTATPASSVGSMISNLGRNHTSSSSTTEILNLPYRTLDIDVSHISADVALPVARDTWNDSDDSSFQPYLIREAINVENRRKLELAQTKQQLQQAQASDGITDTDELPPRPPKPHAAGSGQATPPAFSVHNRLFFVCFHLPVVVVQNRTTGEWQASWSESILAKTEGSQILSTYQAYWVGTVTTHPPMQTDKDREKVRDILEGMKCIPIFLDPNDRHSHYYGFCKQVLWPAFHNIDLLDLSTCGWLSDPKSVASDWDQSRLEDWWQCYIKVNQEFSNKMKSLLRSGDIVWIHDYHLTLLPQQLTVWEMEKFGCKVTRKVFFLHIPFPTSQIFRELECGEKILKGMLHADVVGFHAFDHARHFLNAAKRILGLSYESLVGGLIGVSYQGSTVLVSMSNVSIEPRMIDAALMLPSVQTGREELKRKHFGRSIIGGVDIGQRLSGASLKLLAYERLLQDYPNWQPHVVMVQRLLLPRSRKADEDLTTREVRALVKRIQDKFGTAVIDYQEVAGDSLPMDQRLALWRASDILMSTPIREGLNHWPMEYIYAHKEPEAPGVVITSEFSAVSSILNGALRVNPYDIQEMIVVIDKALGMDAQEREGRRYRDMFFVSSSPSDKWVKNVLRDLRDAIAASTVTGSESTSQISTPFATPNPSRKLALDSTAAFLARETSVAFEHLHLRDLKRAYDVSKRRVIILDFNGTIVLKEPPGKYLKREILGTSGNKPPPGVIEALSILCADPKNTVYVVSGDSSENVLTAVGQLPGLGLAVSNGACFSPPVQNPTTERRRWLTFDLGVDWDAVKRVALPVLSKYTARSNGSFVKLTSFSIGWSYYSCDPEWGSLQATHLVMELENELRSFDVRFVTLKGIVEVVPRKLNKGLIVKKVLQDTAARRPDAQGTGVDFVLCCGDDVSDEKMFTSVLTFAAEHGCNGSGGGDEHATTTTWVPPVFGDTILDTGTGSSVASPPPNSTSDMSAASMGMQSSSSTVPDHHHHPMYAFTVAVGKKSSHANTYVNDMQEVSNALVMLAKGAVPDGGVPIWEGEHATEMFA